MRSTQWSNGWRREWRRPEAPGSTWRPWTSASVSPVGLVPGLVVDAGRARPAGADDSLAAHPVLAALEQGGCSPPAVDLAAGDRRELVRRGLVVDLDGLLFAPSAVDHAARTAAALLAADAETATDGFTVAAFRDAVGATRKHAVPLLTELDRRGVTRRRGDRRIAGPRLPRL
jgi:selenocysteine-specific elongation factor